MTELKTYLDHLTPISIDTWSKLEILFVEKELKKGDYFIKEDKIAKEIGFMKEGIIRAFYRNNKGFEYNKHFFVNQCFIGGYASLITESVNQINQQALSNCKIFVAKYSAFKGLYPTCGDLERAARILAESAFVEKEQRELEIILLNAEERYKIFQKEYPNIEQQIAQYHIASYLGITPTQLSRIRRKIVKK